MSDGEWHTVDTQQKRVQKMKDSRAEKKAEAERQAEIYSKVA